MRHCGHHARYLNHPRLEQRTRSATKTGGTISKISKRALTKFVRNHGAGKGSNGQAAGGA